MSIIFLNVLLVFLQTTQLVQNAEQLIRVGKYIDAEKQLLLNIEQEKNPMILDHSYHLLDSIYGVQINKRIKDEQEHAISHPKGTITLLISPGRYFKVGSIESRQLALWQKYLKENKDGYLKVRFLESILWYAPESFATQKINIVTQFLKSNDKGLLIRTYDYLSMTMHKKKEYEIAIKYYNQLLQLRSDSSDKATYKLYIADCYYCKEKYDLALKFANEACLIASSNVKNDICEMANLWNKDYKNMLNNPKSKFRRHIYFK